MPILKPEDGPSKKKDEVYVIFFLNNEKINSLCLMGGAELDCC